MTKGFRNQAIKDNSLKRIRDSLSEEEARRVEQTREFETINPGTPAYDIALHLDSLKQQFRDEEMIITKRLWNIENIQNHVNRCQQQLSSGEITETLPDSEVIMNKYELESYIKHQEWLKLGEVRAIPKSLGKVRALVGHKDYVGQDILSNDDFEKYYYKIEKQLADLGHNMYD